MVISPALTVFDNSIHQYLNADFQFTLLDSQSRFSEGPVWSRDGFYLFSDIPQNVIYKIAGGQRKEVYLEESGCAHSNVRDLAEQIGSNGLAYDQDGNLWVCQHGNGAIARYDGTFLKPHITSFAGKPFNSPNDIAVHPDGAVFFSDPPYGLKDQKLNPQQGQDKAAVYCYREGRLEVVTVEYQYPNGVCLSADGRNLFTCSNKPFEAAVIEWDAASLTRKRTVAAETADGIKCDHFGNLYLCNKEGLLILNPDGKRLALIRLETIPANCCWGGADGNDLLLTARQNIFLIPGLQKP